MSKVFGTNADGEKTEDAAERKNQEGKSFDFLNIWTEKDWFFKNFDRIEV